MKINHDHKSMPWIGFFGGILIIAVGIEIVRAFSTHGPEAIFWNTSAYLGRFEWLLEYQTLFTGAAALGAAYFSIRAVRDQINQSERLENARIDAKRSAARAVLPLSLSRLSEYADEMAKALNVAHELCTGGILPKGVSLPDFPDLPDEVISPIKEMIEFSEPEDRRLMWQMLVRIQVLRTRIAEMSKSHMRSTSIVTESNLDAYILDATEIYVRSSALYAYARGAEAKPPSIVTRAMMAKGLPQVGIYDDLRDHLVKRYGLDGDKPWGEQWLS